MYLKQIGELSKRLQSNIKKTFYLASKFFCIKILFW